MTGAFGLKDIDDSATPDNTDNWNSITHMEVVSQLSEAFKTEFDVEEITQMESIAKMKQILRDHKIDV